MFVLNALHCLVLFSNSTERAIHLSKWSYYDNDFVSAESGALETRHWKNERNRQHFMTGSSLWLAPVIKESNVVQERLCAIKYRSFSLSRNKKNKSKTIQWKKLRNCDVLEDKKIRYFTKFQACAFPQTSDIRRNVSKKFTEPSMETPCWCTSVVHQYGGRKIL